MQSLDMNWILTAVGLGVALWSVLAVTITVQLARRKEREQFRRLARGFSRLLREPGVHFTETKPRQ